MQRRVSRIGSTLGLAAVMAMSCSGGIAAAAVGNPGEQVIAEVYSATGGPTQDAVSIEGLVTCPSAVPYTGPNIEMHLPDGSLGPTQAVSANAWTLGSVLPCLATPISLNAVKSITVVGPQGAQLEPGAAITPGDLNPAGSDFANPQEYPLIFSNGTGITYDRPWRGGSDANSLDNFTVDDPAPFEFEVFEGSTFTVTVSSSTASIVAGTPVHFSTTAPGASGQTTYSWSFDGGANPQTTADPAVTFASPGVYDVTVQVIDSSGGTGIGTDQVTVGAATTPTVSTPTVSTPPRPTGPIHSGGTTPGGAPGKHPGTGATKAGGNHHGTTSQTQPKPHHHQHKPVATPKPAVAAPPPKPVSKPKPRPVHSPKPGSTAKPAPTTTTATHVSTRTTPTVTGTAPTVTTPTRTATTPTGAGRTARPPGAATPSGSPPGRSTGPKAPNAAGKDATTPAPSERPSPPAPHHKPASSTPPSRPSRTQPPGKLIHGRSLSGLDAKPAAASPLVAEVGGTPAIATAPALRPPPGRSPLGGVAAALAVCGLLGLGAWRELRRGRGPRRPRHRT